MKIIFDLDDVLREMTSYFVKKYDIPFPQTWNFDIKGRDIMSRLREDTSVLLKMKPTKYLKVVKKYIKEENIEIWTAQPADFRDLTTQWVKRYIGKKCKLRFLFGDQKRKELDKRKGTILIEDSPNFKDYRNIVLISYPDNECVKNVCSVRNIKMLEFLLGFYH